MDEITLNQINVILNLDFKYTLDPFDMTPDEFGIAPAPEEFNPQGFIKSNAIDQASTKLIDDNATKMAKTFCALNNSKTSLSELLKQYQDGSIPESITKSITIHNRDDLDEEIIAIQRKAHLSLIRARMQAVNELHNKIITTAEETEQQLSTMLKSMRPLAQSNAETHIIDICLNNMKSTDLLQLLWDRMKNKVRQYSFKQTSDKAKKDIKRAEFNEAKTRKAEEHEKPATIGDIIKAIKEIKVKPALNPKPAYKSAKQVPKPATAKPNSNPKTVNEPKVAKANVVERKAKREASAAPIRGRPTKKRNL
jgi:hypothetical protein